MYQLISFSLNQVKTHFRPIGYFEAEIQTDDFKFQAPIFITDDISTEFNLIIDTDVIRGSLIVFGTDVTINKSQNNSLVDVINLNEITVNIEFNSYSSTLYSSDA